MHSSKGQLCLMAFCLSAAIFASLPLSAEPEKQSDVSARWSTQHTAFNGPDLTSQWFAEHRAVVYLIPTNGDIPAFRRAASAIMQDQWTGGDWSLKHIFVSDVPNRLRFAAQQRLGVHDIATQVTAEAGQPAEMVSENEPFVRDHVYFVWDPKGSLWEELLAGESTKNKNAILFLDYGGKVVKVFDPKKLSEGEAQVGQSSLIATEARRLLPPRDVFNN